MIRRTSQADPPGIPGYFWGRHQNSVFLWILYTALAWRVEPWALMS